MKTQHTPGPWHIDDLAILDSTNIGTLANINPENDGPSAEDYANAQLIAAAPELLAALDQLSEKTRRANDIQHRGGEILPEDWSELYDLTNEAQAAIAKATPKTT